MKSKPPFCDRELLHQSLGDSLSEDQENELADHLSQCAECQRELEHLAVGTELSDLGEILRQEAERSRHGWADVGLYAGLGPQFHGDDSLNLLTDFAVDFLDPPATPQSLGRLGDIDIQELIGRGSMGIVLKGFQQELNRPVAVKVLAPHLATSGAARKRFAREARATAVIAHPNVMPILTVDASSKLPYLVMPYAACQSLQQRLDCEGPLETIDIVRIAMQVSGGLAAAHAQGLVHRDIKPGNILLEKGIDRAMLTDFGLARAVDDATLTRTGVIVGTPQYMSPEQARGESIDPRSDLFSLGSVLYAMCTGRPPFRAESSYGILRRIADTEPRAIREINQEIPPWLCEIVERLHSKTPAERFETAEGVADLLGRWLAHMQQPNSVPAPVWGTMAKSHASKAIARKRHMAIAACVAAAGLLVAMGFWMAFGWSQPPQSDSPAQPPHAAAQPGDSQELDASQLRTKQLEVFGEEDVIGEANAAALAEATPEEEAVQDAIQGMRIALEFQPRTPEEDIEHRSKAREALRQSARFLLTLERIRSIAQEDPKQQRETVDDVTNYAAELAVAGQEKTAAVVALLLVRTLRDASQWSLMADAYQRLVKILAQSDDEQVLSRLRTMEANAQPVLDGIEETDAAGESKVSRPTGRLVPIDLTAMANQQIVDLSGPGYFEANGLAELSQGDCTLCGVKFRIGQKVVQLGRSSLPITQAKAAGILVNRRITRLYLLHATQRGSSSPCKVEDGTPIGGCTVHYEDDSTAAMPIVYGEDVRDWWNWDRGKPVTRGRVVWTGNNLLTEQREIMLRLYLSVWENPHPDRKVTTVDYFWTRGVPVAPFCVAITAEEASTDVDY